MPPGDPTSRRRGAAPDDTRHRYGDRGEADRSRACHGGRGDTPYPAPPPHPRRGQEPSCPSGGGITRRGASLSRPPRAANLKLQHSRGISLRGVGHSLCADTSPPPLKTERQDIYIKTNKKRYFSDNTTEKAPEAMAAPIPQQDEPPPRVAPRGGVGWWQQGSSSGASGSALTPSGART